MQLKYFILGGAAAIAAGGAAVWYLSSNGKVKLFYRRLSALSDNNYLNCIQFCDIKIYTFNSSE